MELGHREQPVGPEIITERKSSAFEAQAKLTQSVSSFCSSQSESKMNDINHNYQATVPGTANGNTTEVTNTETVKEDINKNEKVVKNTKQINAAKMAAVAATVNNEVNVKEAESCENGKDETDTEVNLVQEEVTQTKEPEGPEAKPYEEEPVDEEPAEATSASPLTSPVFVPKNKYTDELSPVVMKCSDIELLEKIKAGALSKNKPNALLLEASNVIRTVPMQESKESESTRTPTRFRKNPLLEEDQYNRELYEKFSGILNKLTPQTFNTLLDEVKTLEINNQRRLEGVIGLIFEQAIDKPNSSEVYAAMCNKLSMLKVPAESATYPEQCVNFRALIINKCQNEFDAIGTDEQVLKLEKEYNECTDLANKTELHAMLQEEIRHVRLRSVGNVKFIGELYKLKMLTCKIMDYCMKYLIDKLEEEKLECLCTLLTTIGEQMESEETSQLDNIFKNMQEIVHRKSDKISSSIELMIRNVIALRKKKWVGESVVDSQSKMMDQIQKDIEQHQRHRRKWVGKSVVDSHPKMMDQIQKETEQQQRHRRKWAGKSVVNSKPKMMDQIQKETEQHQRFRMKWVGKSVVDSQPKMMDQMQKETEKYQRHIEVKMKSFSYPKLNPCHFNGELFYQKYKGAEFLKDKINLQNILCMTDELKDFTNDLKPGESFEMEGMFLEGSPLIIMKSGRVDERDVDIEVFTPRRLSGLAAAYLLDNFKE